jgi:hypothetical protein
MEAMKNKSTGGLTLSDSKFITKLQESRLCVCLWHKNTCRSMENKRVQNGSSHFQSTDFSQGYQDNSTGKIAFFIHGAGWWVYTSLKYEVRPRPHTT